MLVDTRHRFPVAERRPATHLRIEVYPDGGLSRLRCFGELSAQERERLQHRLTDRLPSGHRVLAPAHQV